MAEFPALPLWTDAYLGDTRHLSQSEHGAYLLLLITAWRTPNCSLPDDDRLLARYAGGVDMRTWRHQKATIMAFWDLRDGRWYQKRLTTERRYLVEASKERSRAGLLGAEARWRRTGEITVHNKINGLEGRNGGFTEIIDRDIPANVQAGHDANQLNNKETSTTKPSFCQWQIDGKSMAPTPTPIKKERRYIRSVSDSADKQFDSFWRAYPSRGGHANPKKPAREKFAAAVKHGVDPALIIRAAENYAASIKRNGTSALHTAQALTWLSQCRWEQYGAPEEPEPPRAGMI